MTDAPTSPPPRSRRRHLLGAAVLSTVLLSGIAVGVLRPAAADEGPEISLKAGDKKVIVSDRPMGTTGAGENGPSKPADCADDPTIAVACDVYRLSIDLDPNEDALNFVTLRLDFDTPTVPSLTAVAVGLNPIGAADLNIGVWDVSGEKPVRMAVAGAGDIKNPEIAAFEPTMKEYLVTIESDQAPVLGYSLTASFSNELFGTPFEALDPSLGGGPEDLSGARPVDDSGDRPATPAPAGFDDLADLAPPPAFGGSELLAPAPVVADSDFAGFRGVVDDALAPPAIDARNAGVVLPKPKDPGAAVLVFWLLVVPFLVLGFVAAVLRRRRPSALQG